MSNSHPIVYFDNAATSWPKPEDVVSAMSRFMIETGANSGRSGHSMALDSGRIVFETRELISEFFGLGDSSGVVFTSNATSALNIAMKGILDKGDHVITSRIEHNSVLRPLNALKDESNISISEIPCDKDGALDMDSFQNAFLSNTKLVIINQRSMVGTVSPSPDGEKLFVQTTKSFQVIDLENGEAEYSRNSLFNHSCSNHMLTSTDTGW